MRRFLFILLLLAISMASGQLLSKASWIGRMGMTFFYKEYNFTKVWWQGASAVFIFLLIMYILHSLVQLLPGVVAKLVHVLLLLAAAGALYLTYDDFQNDMAHRMLRRRFHYGVYLVWIGWMAVAIFFLFTKKRVKVKPDAMSQHLKVQHDDLTFELPTANRDKTGQAAK